MGVGVGVFWPWLCLLVVGVFRFAYCTSLLSGCSASRYNFQGQSFFFGATFSFRSAIFAINSIPMGICFNLQLICINCLTVYSTLPALSASSLCSAPLPLSPVGVLGLPAAFKRLTRFLKSKTEKFSVQTNRTHSSDIYFYAILCFSWNSLMLGSMNLYLMQKDVEHFFTLTLKKKKNHKIIILEWFLKDHVTLKINVMATKKHFIQSIRAKQY